MSNGCSGRAAAKAPLCLQCKHFYVTYDIRQPRGCRAFGFKSRRIPADIVQSSSGKLCTLFAVRRKVK